MGKRRLAMICAMIFTLALALPGFAEAARGAAAKAYDPAVYNPSETGVDLSLLNVGGAHGFTVEEIFGGGTGMPEGFTGFPDAPGDGFGESSGVPADGFGESSGAPAGSTETTDAGSRCC